MSHLAAVRRCLRKSLLASFESTICVPRTKLEPLVPRSLRAPQLHDSACKELVFIYFLPSQVSGVSDDEAAAILLSSQTSDDSLHSSLKCSCRFCADNSLVGRRVGANNGLRSLSDLSRSTHRTMIFKADKQSHNGAHGIRQELEHSAVKRFPSIQNSFIVTTYCRAYCEGTLLDLITAPLASCAPVTPKHISDGKRVMGILMERCVASLADVLRADSFVDSDNCVTRAARFLVGFEWQTTTSSSDDQSRPSFASLCEATCVRLLADLRDPQLLIPHFIHLCHAVRYMHAYGVVHGDLKPENVFVRVVQSTPTAVAAVLLVIGDFDCSHVFDVQFDHAHCPTSVNWTGKQYSSKTGTVNYIPAIYSPHVSYADALSCASNNMLPNKHQDNEAVYPALSTSFDVFGLGMVFLTMLLRCPIRSQVMLWIKREIISCPTSRCTPAHTIFFHNHLEMSHTTTGTAPTAPKESKDTVAFRRAQERVKKEAEVGYIATPLIALLHRMTDEKADRRPKLHECIESLQGLRTLKTGEKS